LSSFDKAIVEWGRVFVKEQAVVGCNWAATNPFREPPYNDNGHAKKVAHGISTAHLFAAMAVLCATPRAIWVCVPWRWAF